VIWLSEAEKGTGYAVEFLDVTLHAVSRDPETYPSPCLYTQVIRDTAALQNFVVLLTNLAKWLIGFSSRVSPFLFSLMLVHCSGPLLVFLFWWFDWLFISAHSTLVSGLISE
jgi:hypothetical protein